MLYILPILFALVAWLYAMAGFGGGSTYIALLAVSGLPLAVVPTVSLLCNVIVSSQGSFLLLKGGHAKWAILAPLLIGSIPCAYLGGRWRLPEELFIALLAGALTIASLAMFAQNTLCKEQPYNHKQPHAVVLAVVGALLGAVAGITGIGGGIYLAPVMHLCRWADGRTVAACTSLFIALNSIAGLAGQLSKAGDLVGQVPTWLLVACPIAVLIGGRFGSGMLTNNLPQEKVRGITAAVILLVAVRLWLKVFGY